MIVMQKKKKIMTNLANYIGFKVIVSVYAALYRKTKIHISDISQCDSNLYIFQIHISMHQRHYGVHKFRLLLGSVV